MISILHWQKMTPRCRLRAECGTLMPAESARVDAIARAWFDRNKDDIVSARVWLDQYLSHAKSISTQQYQRESGALLKALSIFR